MHAVVFFLYRLGHNLLAYIIVDCGWGDDLFLLELGRHVVQVSAQERDHLIHVQADVRDLPPGREAVIVQVLFPAAQLACDQFFVVCHGCVSEFNYHIPYYNTFDLRIKMNIPMVAVDIVLWMC